MFRGVVLAGGRSRRFGRNKALERHSGSMLIEKPIRVLESLDISSCIVSNSDQNYGFLNRPIVTDLISNCGPLGGMYSAMKSFPEDTLIMMTCDMPLVTEELLVRLIENHKAKKSLATLYKTKREGKEFLEPFPGIYEAQIANDILGLIRDGKLSMRHYLDILSDKTVLSFKEDLSLIQNINRQTDLLV